MGDQKNTFLAIALSALVLIGWQYFFAGPQLQKQEAQKLEMQKAQQAQTPAAPGAAPAVAPGTAPGVAPQVPGAPAAGAQPATAATRDAVISQGARIAINTNRLKGSIALKGARLDDLSLDQYRETVDPKSPAIVLLSPSGAPNPFYAEFGWVGATGTTVKLPAADTVWKQVGAGALTADKPITLTYDNGAGLLFKRIIAIDDKYLFTVKDSVVNNSPAPVSLHPYGLISRHGAPKVEGFYILHEGLIGVLGEKGLQEETYKNVEEKKNITFSVTNAWFGITDKYWAAALLPDTKAKVDARFSSNLVGTTHTYQTDYLLQPVTIAPGATGEVDGRLFAGAKEVSAIDGYDKTLGLNRFELMIDWGWFYFITKPMFWAIDWFFRLLGNFGVAILAVTVIVKILFFPLANKSYASMAKMKNVQPQMAALKERYPDDKVKQQQELMELYKKEKINPIAGCLPILIQVPVFFSLYKVLFVTIEMRHAPFFGWIKDLSAPDPTTIFNLFGLIPWDPSTVPVFGHYLMLGVWPLLMGVTMWFQMKLNPAPPDPTQKIIFDWMPVIFTFMLSSFSAGLVIYWAWNNTLSVLQQSVIMHKNGAKIELFDNLKALFKKKPPAAKT